MQTPGGGSPEDSNSPDDHHGKLESQTSTDSDKNSPTQVGIPAKSYSIHVFQFKSFKFTLLDYRQIF